MIDLVGFGVIFAGYLSPEFIKIQKKNKGA